MIISPQQACKCVPLEQVILQATSCIHMTFPHFCPVGNSDAYTEGEPWVHGSVKKVTVTHECVALRVLAMPARRGAAVVVDVTRAVLGPGRVYNNNQVQGCTGISSTWGQPQHATWKSPTGFTTQIQAV